MPDSKRFLHPDAIRRITRLDLRAKQIVEGSLSGMHRSPFFGQSIEFLQHREYVPGDDLRHVDWKVWARQDRLYVKQYEEETNLQCYLLVDRSSSMQYAGNGYSKFEYACTLAACLAYLVLKQQDAVGAITFDQTVRDVLPATNSANQLTKLTALLDASKTVDASDLSLVFSRVMEIFPRRGIVLVFSDLFADVETTLKGLRLLRQAGHEVAVLHVMDDDELNFSFDGPTRFEDLESAGTLNCNPQALREGYLEALATFLHELRHGAAKAELQYKLIRTSQHFDAVLAEFLTERLASR